MKKIVHSEIDKYDHSCILRKTDPLAEPIFITCKKVFLVDDNPTAEWMAEKFFLSVSSELQKIDPELRLISVSVQETENNIATYTQGGRCKCE